MKLVKLIKIDTRAQGMTLKDFEMELNEQLIQLQETDAKIEKIVCKEANGGSLLFTVVYSTKEERGKTDGFE